MGLYIGYVEKRNYDPSVFFNFKPIAELRDGTLYLLTIQELDELLPNSERHNINLSYSFGNAEERRRIDSIVKAGSLAAFEFTTDELSDNYKSNGERNPTGYRVQAVELIEQGKIRPIDEVGVYYLLRHDNLQSNFLNDTVVEIDAPFVLENDRVFVETNDRDFYSGPYEVGFRDYTHSYYIKPEISEHKYTIEGFSHGHIQLINLYDPEQRWDLRDYEWTIVIPNPDTAPEQKDVITRQALLEGFRDSVNSNITQNGVVRVDDIQALIDRYDQSVLSGSNLSPKIKQARLSNLFSILTSGDDVDNTLRTITEYICDLLVRYKDNENVEEWLKSLIAAHPDLLDQLRDSRAILSKIEELEQVRFQLDQERQSIEHSIQEMRQTAEQTEQAAIEAKKQQLLKMDADYLVLSSRLETVKTSLGITGDIAALQEKQTSLQNDVDYLNRHVSHLRTEATGLEMKFLELVNNQHQRMVDIAFDGFMASKMLSAAAEWEAGEAERRHMDLLHKVNGIHVESRSPENLVDYLCRTVQIARPTYSRNTIINIAICLSQSFLTVLAGEPGCGKTSICNIICDVLGLNKISKVAPVEESEREAALRYIPVSVERGWTSKRDFVGYYNPLSKTFDKSNRRIYDAFKLLNSEKHEELTRFPFVILLDEANLSPMEYYWSDFMNICDDLGQNSNVNLGEDYVFSIPETLHFLATINNDHTTERLSPRLVDRACIITLRQQQSELRPGRDITPEDIQIVTWESLKQAFVPSETDCRITTEYQKTYEDIITHLKKMRYTVSPRVEFSIRRYWSIASQRFEMDELKTDPGTIALDYAVAQRILPKISGNGEAFGKWLEELRDLCRNRSLNHSADIIREILDRGNQQMKYYKFFA